MGAERKTETVQVKQVEVKRYSGDIASLRARMEMDANMIEPETNQSMEMGAADEGGMNSTDLDMAASMVMADVAPVAEALGKAISDRVDTTVLDGGKGDLSTNFLNAVRVGSDKSGISGEDVTAVMDEVGSELVAGALAKVGGRGWM